MFLLLLPAVFAGDLSLALDSDGAVSAVHLEGLAPCATHRFVREETGGQVLRVDVRVEPLGDRELQVHLGVERSTWGEPVRKLEMRPTLQVRDGREARLAFGTEAASSTLTVEADGFARDAVCPTTVSVQRSRVERRGGPSDR